MTAEVVYIVLDLQTKRLFLNGQQSKTGADQRTGMFFIKYDKQVNKA